MKNFDALYEELGFPELKGFSGGPPPEPVDIELLHRLVVRELSDDECRRTYFLIANYREWSEAYDRVLEASQATTAHDQVQHSSENEGGVDTAVADRVPLPTSLQWLEQTMNTPTHELSAPQSNGVRARTTPSHRLARHLSRFGSLITCSILAAIGTYWFTIDSQTSELSFHIHFPNALHFEDDPNQPFFVYDAMVHEWHCLAPEALPFAIEGFLENVSRFNTEIEGTPLVEVAIDTQIENPRPYISVSRGGDSLTIIVSIDSFEEWLQSNMDAINSNLETTESILSGDISDAEMIREFADNMKSGTSFFRTRLAMLTEKQIRYVDLQSSNHAAHIEWQSRVDTIKPQHLATIHRLKKKCDECDQKQRELRNRIDSHEPDDSDPKSADKPNDPSSADNESASRNTTDEPPTISEGELRADVLEFERGAARDEYLALILNEVALDSYDEADIFAAWAYPQLRDDARLAEARRIKDRIQQFDREQVVSSEAVRILLEPVEKFINQQQTIVQQIKDDRKPEEKTAYQRDLAFFSGAFDRSRLEAFLDWPEFALTDAEVKLQLLAEQLNDGSVKDRDVILELIRLRVRFGPGFNASEERLKESLSKLDIPGLHRRPKPFASNE